MSEPTAGEVLGMLADWRDAQHAYLTQDDDNEDSLFVRLTVTERRLDKLDPAHLRTLANALTPPAPASAQVVVNREGLGKLLEKAYPEDYVGSGTNFCVCCEANILFAHEPDCPVPVLEAAVKSEKGEG